MNDATTYEYSPEEQERIKALNLLFDDLVKGKFRTHPQADKYPMLEGKEMDDLEASIFKNGLISPIAYDEKGRVVDGRNRLTAILRTQKFKRTEGFDMFECLHLPTKDIPIKPWTVGLPTTFIPSRTAARQVLALNMTRRHLTKDQKAAIIALTTKKVSTEERSKLANSAQGKGEITNSVKTEKVETDEERGKKAGVGKDKITAARKLPEEELEKVVKGEKKLPKRKPPAASKPAAPKPAVEKPKATTESTQDAAEAFADMILRKLDANDFTWADLTDALFSKRPALKSQTKG